MEVYKIIASKMEAVLSYFTVILCLFTCLDKCQTGGIVDYCLNESFNVTCEGASVVLITSAKFGRMRSGRCISGELNVGCSKDIKPHLDSLCSAKSSCDVSVRSLVDLHPCQRDFVSYLEASYTCIEVSGLHEDSCPANGLVRPQGLEGYLARRSIAPSSSSSASAAAAATSMGTESCPWEINVMRGQKINLTLMTQDLQQNSPVDDSTTPCRTTVVVDDLVAGRRLHLHVCSGGGGKRGERLLATSTGNRVRLYVTDDDDVTGSMVILLHYAAVGCPDVRPPANAWIQKIGDGGDNLMVRCNDSLETWYLACQSNRWLGDVGNCSRRAIQLILNEIESEKPYSFNGVLLAVMIGVVLGVVIGMVLLIALHWLRRRTTVGLKRPHGGGRSLLSNPQKEIDEMLPINLLPPDQLDRRSPDPHYAGGFLTDIEMQLDVSDRCSCSRECGDFASLCPFPSMYTTTATNEAPHQQHHRRHHHHHDACSAVPLVHTDLGRLRLGRGGLSDDECACSGVTPETTSSDGRCICQVTGDNVDLLRSRGSVEVTNFSAAVSTIEPDRTKLSSTEVR